MAPRCARSDLPLEQCAHCTGDDDFQVHVIKREPENFGPWFTAAHYGRCANCDTDTDPGDDIRADGEEGYLCEWCGDG